MTKHNDCKSELLSAQRSMFDSYCSEIARTGPALLIFISLMLVPNVALAAGGFEALATYILGLVNNSIVLQAFATVAVIAAGILALTGRIQWGRFFIVFFGIAIIFGAAELVTEISEKAAGK